MNPDDERQATANRWMVTMPTGGGKTRAFSLTAYWHLLQTPVEGEDEQGGPADGRFTPVPPDELERRLAELDNEVAEPLPEVIESLSDSSRFLAPAEGPPQEVKKVPHNRQRMLFAASFRQPGTTREQAQAERSYASRKRRADALQTGNPSLWAEVERAFSTVLYVGSTHQERLPRKLRPAEQSRFSDFIRSTDVWLDMLTEREVASQCRRETAAADCFTQPVRSWTVIQADQRLRAAVWEFCATLTSTITVYVDHTGAARDPNAALNSLIADATNVCATATNDGRWALLVTAPAAGSDAYPALIPPRLAVMELPGAPPRLDSGSSMPNDPDEELLRRLKSALGGAL
ncbi:hypothetical protein ABZS98_38300 [Streptomyces avermitilis]|uniref:hypothetical protein n=1 Tax=Streptomyces avermitilis TaxID=33903 RepID=UPI0033B7782D